MSYRKNFIMPLLFFALGLFTAMDAETRVAGIISSDTDWRIEKSPFLVTGDIWVKREAVLRIEAGCLILVLGKNGANSRDSLRPIPQLDESDSQLISIKVDGGLLVAGHEEKRITFMPAGVAGTTPVSWYGIVLNEINEDYSEFGHLDISGAVYGLRVVHCKPEIYKTILSHNNTGIFCDKKSVPIIRNCTIAHNLACGIFIREANPNILCSIIAFNRNHGIWSDGMSRIEASHNCIFGSGDGDLMDCPINLGRIVRINSRGDSCDKWFNIYQDPVFAGSVADSQAREDDMKLATDASRIKDTSLAKITAKELKDNQAAKARHRQYAKYTLSSYSPCIGAGKADKRFNNSDGSKNNMGAYGGPPNKLE